MTIKVKTAKQIKELVETTCKIVATGKKQCLLLLAHKQRFEVGIANFGIRGFTPTGIVVDIPFEEGEALINIVNEKIYPRQSKMDNAEIVMSTIIAGTDQK
jgi:hypothetical protein